MEDTLLKKIDKLSKSEKIALVEALWDSIAADPDKVELSENHKKILDERLQNLEEDVRRSRSWDEIKKDYI